MKDLLIIAREAITAHLNEKNPQISQDLIDKYSSVGASFVTLTIEEELRGCIGTLQADKPLWQDVVNNAIHAAVNDPRFLPLDPEELDNIHIEVSVLSKPEKIEYKDDNDLLNKIDKDMGIILKNGYSSATYLPQVWEQISDKKLFLESLAQKAGLAKNDWKDASIWFYKVKKIKED